MNHNAATDPRRILCCCRALVLVLLTYCVFLAFSCKGSCWLSSFLVQSLVFVLGLPKVASKTTWEHLHPPPPTPSSGAMRVLCIASVIRLRRFCTPLVQSLGRPRTRDSCLSFHLPHGSACRCRRLVIAIPSQFGNKDQCVLSSTPSWTPVKSSFKVVSPRSRRRCHPQQHNESSDAPPRLLIGVIARLCEGKVILLTGSLSLLVGFRCSGDHYGSATWVEPPDLEQPINLEAEAFQPVQLWVGILTGASSHKWERRPSCA